MGQTVNGVSGPRVEYISYAPLIQDSTDLEAATKTINAIAEPGAADYTANLTIPASPDPRLIVTRIAGRLQVTIDSWAGGGTTLNYRVKRAGVSVATGQLEAAAGTGAKYAAWDVADPTGLGSAQAYTVYLWVNQGSCVISVCQIWTAVGSGTTTSSTLQSCLTLNHTGFFQVAGMVQRQGSGNFNAGIRHAATGLNGNNGNDWLNYFMSGAGTGSIIGANTNAPLLSPGSVYFALYNQTVTTDLTYYGVLRLVLRTD